MSKGETRAQKDKKNKNRILAKERGFFPTIQKNYTPKKEKPIPEDEDQLSLF